MGSDSFSFTFFSFMKTGEFVLPTQLPALMKVFGIHRKESA
jgi:hypothetical protein